MQKFFLFAIICLSVLIPSVFALDQSINIPMSASQSTNPLTISANNGTNYFLIDPNGLVKLAKNHKLCLDNSCVTFLVSDGNSISFGSTTGMNTAQITNLGTANGFGIWVSRANATNNNLRSITCGAGLVCSNNATNTRINSTGVGAAITSLNGDTTTAQKILRGNSNSTTITNSTGTLKIGLKPDVVLTNGSNQEVSKQLTLDNLVLGGVANANNQRLISLGNATKYGDAQNVGHLGLSTLSLTPLCTTSQTYIMQANGTFICAIPTGKSTAG
jgi:hypothetical protein